MQNAWQTLLKFAIVLNHPFFFTISQIYKNIHVLACLMIITQQKYRNLIFNSKVQEKKGKEILALKYIERSYCSDRKLYHNPVYHERKIQQNMHDSAF